MTPLIKKEICSYCSKYINIGQSICECTKCDCVIHTKCYKSSNFDIINGSYFCDACKTDIVTRYNPYKFDNDMNVEDNEYTYVSETLHKLSNILESCKPYTVNDVNNIPSSNFTENISTFFLNVDGNQTNFDNLIVEMEQFKHTFSIIGIAETNTDATNSSIYNIPDYNSFYQDTQPNKKKGTGVALYVHKSLNATINYNLSQNTPNI